MKSDNLRLKDRYLKTYRSTKIKMQQQVALNSYKEMKRVEVKVLIQILRVTLNSKMVQQTSTSIKRRKSKKSILIIFD